MHPALLDRANGSGRDKDRPRPAPTKGWNASDSLSNMDPGYAIQLRNYFPDTDTVRLRRGTKRHTGFVGHITAFSRTTTGTYFGKDGLLKTAAINEPRYTWYAYSDLATLFEQPIFYVESSRTEYCLYNRDLTNAAWTASNITPTKDATGIDGVANSATRLTATSANGTITQAVTAPSSQKFQFYIKRVTGSGTVEYTVDGGSNWVDITVPSDWDYVRRDPGLSPVGTNPTIGFRLATSGDEIAVDFVGVISGLGTPIATTSSTVTTGADTPTYSSGASAGTMTEDVESLLCHTSGVTETLLAFAADSIYDVTDSVPPGVPDVTGLNSSRWNGVNFKGYLFMLSGLDTPRTFDGTTHATQTITGSGLTATDLKNPWIFKERIFMIESGTLNAWYLATGAISGAASKLDFSGFVKEGGYLVAGGNWSRDGGDGLDDLCVFITNKGEALVYQGTDPSSANTWALVGVYKISAPIGDRPLIDLGGELVIITEDGFIPISAALANRRVSVDAIAISQKIRKAVNSAVRSYGSNFGWDAVLYPKGNMVLFNIPKTESVTSEQYVLNTMTGAWCQFTGINALCWGMLGRSLYFGAPNGFVVKYDEEPKDDALTYAVGNDITYADIVGDIWTAFDYLGNRSVQKMVVLVRPLVSTNGSPTVSSAINMDYEVDSLSTSTTSEQQGSLWDVALWDVAEWATSDNIIKDWQSLVGFGYCASTRWRTSTKGVDISFQGFDYKYIPSMGGL